MKTPESAVKNYQFVVPLTAEQKDKYDSKRKGQGSTSQGCMRKLVLKYIGEAKDDGDSD